MPIPTRTTVAIIGAGPAGLLLGHLLHQSGIDFVILEARSREYVLERIRAGVLEQASVDVLTSLGLDDHVQTRGLVHDGIYLQFERERHRVDFHELIGRTVTVYGQQAVVRDLLEAHDRIGSPVFFEATEVQPHAVDGPRPRVTFTYEGAAHELEADFVVGADGFHGVSRTVVPATELAEFERMYPAAWLGILANVAPSTDELIYALHRDGFAMHSMRSAEVSRLYVQVDPDASIDDWSDRRIWDTLQERLGVDGWTLAEGEITEKSISPMRSFVASTLNYGRLFLVGDAGHIVPPTGAKGLNSAIADVAMLGRALADHTAGDSSGLATYSERALARQWKIQYFSQWMTDMLHIGDLHTPADVAAFRYRSQVGQLRYVTGSRHAMSSLAEQYTGLPIDFGGES